MFFVFVWDVKFGVFVMMIVLCLMMDFVVVVCVNGGILIVFWLNWNKFWMKILVFEFEMFMCVMFCLDGKVFVVGYVLGVIMVYVMEDGECLRVIMGLEGFERDARDGASGIVVEWDKGGEGGSDGCGIMCLWWIDVCEGVVVCDESWVVRYGWNGTRDGAREREGGASARFMGKCELWNVVGLVDYFESMGKFSVFVVVNVNGVVVMYVFGMFCVGLWRDAFAKIGSVEALVLRDDFMSVDVIVCDVLWRKVFFVWLDVVYMVVYVREVYLVFTYVAYLKTLLERVIIVVWEVSVKYE